MIIVEFLLLLVIPQLVLALFASLGLGYLLWRGPRSPE